MSLLVFLLMTQLVIGQLQCPNVATSFGADLNLSSFSLSLHDVGDGVGEYGRQL